MIPTREEAWTILKKYNDSEALLRHGLTVEGCMRHFAELAGEDPELWGAVGLLHDVDYGKISRSALQKSAGAAGGRGRGSPGDPRGGLARLGHLLRY